MAPGSALVAIGLVAIAALLPGLRPVALAGGGIGLAIAVVLGRGRTDRASLVGPWAAACAVTLLLVWGTIPAPLAASDGSDCGNPLSPPAAWRTLEALVVLIAIAVLARLVGARRQELAMTWPGATGSGLAVVIVVIVAPLAVLLGPSLARPFFGPVALPGADEPAAILPALLFALANGSMEELLYRGALPDWLGRAIGRAPAIAAAALLFGLQHATGAEFTGSSLPVVAAMAAGGLFASGIVLRTGSLAVPIAFHVAFDVPLYYYWACRW